MDIIIIAIIVIIIFFFFFFFTRIYITIDFNYYQFFLCVFVVVVERIEIVFKTILSIIIMYLNFSSNVLVIFSLLFPLYNIFLLFFHYICYPTLFKHLVIIRRLRQDQMLILIQYSPYHLIITALFNPVHHTCLSDTTFFIFC